jgi:hypothetical protein
MLSINTKNVSTPLHISSHANQMFANSCPDHLFQHDTTSNTLTTTTTHREIKARGLVTQRTQSTHVDERDGSDAYNEKRNGGR